MSAEGPQVEVVIACHSDRRALPRAVASVLDGNAGPAKVTVVAHNIGADRLRSTLTAAHAERVRWLELSDGTSSPANPYNLGTEQASAPWVSLLGSGARSPLGLPWPRGRTR